MSDQEMAEILRGIARDPNVVALTRVRAINSLREIEGDQPLDQDSEVASISQFMARRSRRDYDSK